MWPRRKFRPAELLSTAAEHEQAPAQRIREADPAYAAEPTPGDAASHDLRRRGTPPPRLSRRLSFTLDEELSTQLLAAARFQNQLPGELVSELLAHGLRRSIQRLQARASLEALTPREQQVAQLAGRGHTNRQIARTLVISPETVKSHLRHALGKLGLRSKGELRLLMLDLGIRWWQEP